MRDSAIRTSIPATPSIHYVADVSIVGMLRLTMSTTQKSSILNILAQAVRPSRFIVMLKKIGRRFFDNDGSLSNDENLNWLKSNKTDFEQLANSLDADLWVESKSAAEIIEQQAHEALERIEHNLGGGGAYPFLYFLTRYMAPDSVVETGVAAGFSSFSILSALDKNGNGKLFSSDFPYFRLPNPEQYIGIVVPEALKDRWELHIDGDEKNLPRILSNTDSVDIFHYDSDKSYSGREFAMSKIVDRLSANGILLMDDIQDNSFFHDWVQTAKPETWFVFEYENKYVGMVGTPSRRSD
ncbi:MAG: class I SAM-dependent methyltransferase [Woeseiaceae bacterium]|nr:class I SAM-dependent methyltransferase [Woeseiaceae bacterium]